MTHTGKIPAGYDVACRVLRYAAAHSLSIVEACLALGEESILVAQTIRSMREYYLEGYVDKAFYDEFAALRDAADGRSGPTGTPPTSGAKRKARAGRVVEAEFAAAATAEAEIEEARVHTEERRGASGRIEMYHFRIEIRDKAPLEGSFSRSEMETIYAQYPHVTINQLAQSFPRYNSGEMRRILRAFNITKDRKFPPHIIEEMEPDQAADFALNAKEGIAYKKLDLNRAGFIEKELRKTQEELWLKQEEENTVERLATAVLDRYIEEGRLAPAPPLPAYRPRFGESRPVGEPALVFYGDCHFGKQFETEELMGRGRGTNRAILTERLLSLAAETVNQLTNLKTNDLHIFNMGDVFESLLPDGMHPQHALEMELKAEEQLMAALEAHEKMFQYIFDHYKPVDQQGFAQLLHITFHGLGGNHDRLGKSRDEDKRRTGALIFYNMLKKCLSYRLPGVVEVITYPKGVISVVAGNVNVIGFHGDSGLGKVKSTDILNAFRSGDSSLYTIMANGHWHTTVMDEGHNYTRLTVGPVCSADDYVQNNLAKGSQPSAMFAVAAPGYGVDFHKKNLY